MLALVAALIVASAGAFADADDACWHLIYAALQRDAAAPQAAYISYSENVNVFVDGRSLERADASITYRDDGLAYVDDDRWAHPFVSTLLEPGPPVLGPYGESREGWLPAAVARLSIPTIADVHNTPERSCTDEGDRTIDGAAYAYLVLGAPPPGERALKAIWIDRRSFAIAKLVVSGFLYFRSVGTTVDRKLVDYTIDVEDVDGFRVLRRAAWTYVMHAFGQSSEMTAEYDFSDYRFTNAPPPGTSFRV